MGWTFRAPGAAEVRMRLRYCISSSARPRRPAGELGEAKAVKGCAEAAPTLGTGHATPNLNSSKELQLNNHEPGYKWRLYNEIP